MYSVLKDSVFDVIEQSLLEYPDTPVIHSNSNGREPTSSYCTIGKLTVNQKGKADNFITGVGLLSQMSVGYEVSCTVSFIGEHAGQIAFSSHSRLGNTIANRELAQRRSLSISNKSSVKSIPYRRDTQYVDVLSYDISFYFIWGVNEEVQQILQVVIENLDTSETITIPPQI